LFYFNIYFHVHPFLFLVGFRFFRFSVFPAPNRRGYQSNAEFSLVRLPFFCCAGFSISHIANIFYVFVAFVSVPLHFFLLFISFSPSTLVLCSVFFLCHILHANRIFLNFNWIFDWLYLCLYTHNSTH